jgi:hypothetical protein
MKKGGFFSKELGGSFQLPSGITPSPEETGGIFILRHQVGYFEGGSLRLT